MADVTFLNTDSWNSNLLKPLGTAIQQNIDQSTPQELIYLALFTMGHPVIKNVKEDVGVQLVLFSGHTKGA